jgi:hypothetical protein
MGTFAIVLDAPLLDLVACLVERDKKTCWSRHSSRNRALKLSMVRVLDRLARFNELQLTPRS